MLLLSAISTGLLSAGVLFAGQPTDAPLAEPTIVAVDQPEAASTAVPSRVGGPARERLLAGLERRLEEAKRARRFAENREKLIVQAIESVKAGEGFERAMRLIRDRRWNRPRDAARSTDAPREPLLREHDPEAERDKLVAALDTAAPKLAERLRLMSGEDEARLNAALRMAGPRLRELIELHERDPELAELKGIEMQTTLATWDAARKLSAEVNADEPDDSQIAEARATVRQAIGASLDARLAVRNLEADRLRARLAAFDAEAERYSEQRDTQIEAQLAEIERRIDSSDLLNPERFERMRQRRGNARNQRQRPGN